MRGLVARAEGEYARAGDALREAARTFRSCAFLWLEALALIELDATPIDTRGEMPLERAAVIIRDNFPNSFLAARLGAWGRAYIDPIASTLIPAERDVLRRLLEGKGSAEIAAETNRATKTVWKHMSSVFNKFGVHNDRQLLAECYRRGLGAPSWVMPVDDIGQPPNLLAGQL